MPYLKNEIVANFLELFKMVPLSPIIVTPEEYMELIDSLHSDLANKTELENKEIIEMAENFIKKIEDKINKKSVEDALVSGWTTRNITEFSQKTQEVKEYLQEIYPDEVATAALTFLAPGHRQEVTMDPLAQISVAKQIVRFMQYGYLHLIKPKDDIPGPKLEELPIDFQTSYNQLLSQITSSGFISQAKYTNHTHKMRADYAQQYLDLQIAYGLRYVSDKAFSLDVVVVNFGSGGRPNNHIEQDYQGYPFYAREMIEREKNVLIFNIDKLPNESLTLEPTTSGCIILNLQGDFKNAGKIGKFLEKLNPSIPIVFHRYDVGCFDPLTSHPGGEIEWVRNFYANYHERTIEVLSGYFDHSPNYRLSNSVPLAQLHNLFSEFMRRHIEDSETFPIATYPYDNENLSEEVPSETLYQRCPNPEALSLSDLSRLSEALSLNQVPSAKI